MAERCRHARSKCYRRQPGRDRYHERLISNGCPAIGQTFGHSTTSKSSGHFTSDRNLPSTSTYDVRRWFGKEVRQRLEWGHFHEFGSDSGRIWHWQSRTEPCSACSSSFAYQRSTSSSKSNQSVAGVGSVDHCTSENRHSSRKSWQIIKMIFL